MSSKVNLSLQALVVLTLFLWTERCYGQSKPPVFQNITIFAIRLISNSPTTVTQGRVELKGTNGVWGTICPAGWNSSVTSSNVNTTCAMLGFRYGGQKVPNTFGDGAKNFVIENATCPVNASSWYQCTQYFAKKCGFQGSRGITRGDMNIPIHKYLDELRAATVFTNIQHQDEELAVECYPDQNGANVVELATVAAIPGSGGLPLVATPVNTIILNGMNTTNCIASTNARLIGGDIINTTVGNGYVQVKINGQWGFVCTDTWNQAAAKVVCRELCYDNVVGFTPLPGIIAQSVPDPLNRTILLSSLNCMGDESSLLSCPVINSTASCYPDTLLAGVQCRPDCCEDNSIITPEVNCTSEVLIASFSKSKFPLITVNNIIMVNNVPRQCMNVSSNTDGITVIASVTSVCGAELQQNYTHITYKVPIRLLWLSDADIINSYTNTRYDLVCSVAKTYTVTNRMEPFTLAPNMTLYQQYNYSLSLDLYTNCNFTQTYESVGSVYLVEVGQWLSAAVTVQNYDNRTKLILTDCDAYPVVPYSAYVPVKKLIQDRCPVDSTLTMYPLDNRKQGFQVKAFMFAGYSMIYIRCSVNICLLGASSTDCDRSCSKPLTGRRKREASTVGTASVDTKTIFLLDPKDADIYKMMASLGQSLPSQQNVTAQTSEITTATPGNLNASSTEQQAWQSATNTEVKQTEQPAANTGQEIVHSTMTPGEQAGQSDTNTKQSVSQAITNKGQLTETTTAKSSTRAVPNQDEKITASTIKTSTKLLDESLVQRDKNAVSNGIQPEPGSPETTTRTKPPTFTTIKETQKTTPGTVKLDQLLVGRSESYIQQITSYPDKETIIGKISITTTTVQPTGSNNVVHTATLKSTQSTMESSTTQQHQVSVYGTKAADKVENTGHEVLSAITTKTVKEITTYKTQQTAGSITNVMTHTAPYGLLLNFDGIDSRGADSGFQTLKPRGMQSTDSAIPELSSVLNTRKSSQETSSRNLSNTQSQPPTPQAQGQQLEDPAQQPQQVTEKQEKQSQQQQLKEQSAEPDSSTKGNPPVQIGHKGEVAELKGANPNRATPLHMSCVISMTTFVLALAKLFV